jgi:hypothetical protein
MTDQPVFEVDVVYGHAVVDSYFKYENGKSIGMGRYRRYDGNGALVEAKDEPTGITMEWT